MNSLYRIVDRDGNDIKFVMTDVQEDVFDNLHTRNLILKARQLGMCLDPETLVLTDKFTWVKIADLKPGDGIIGTDEFAEKRGKRRRLRPAIVEATRKHIATRYKITFDNGKTLICTGEHRWLTRNSSTDYHWRSINGEPKNRLKVGHKIRRVVTDTWEKGSFDDGWMSGMLDGEGSLAKSSRQGGSIGLSQLDGDVFERMEKYFKDRKYNYRIEIDKAERKSKFGSNPVNKIVVGRVDEIIKLVGITRPTKFIKGTWWHGKEMPQVKDGPFSTVVNIEEIGEGEVVDLQTSTKTFIAEGYVSHNSTFAVLYLLDEALFNFNMSCGIVSYSLQHAQHIFKRIIGHALENMPHELKPVGIVQHSAHEITFSNGSFLRVDTTLRGGTCQLVLISEFGKTCARSPQKAEEIVTGTLNTLSQSGIAIIESTGEGSDGHFAAMVNTAATEEHDENNPLSYKLFFYPWHEEPLYRMKNKVEWDTDLTDYFEKIENEAGITLDLEQKNWYAAKKAELGDKMGQEFPSTIQESFLSSSDAYYYAEYIAKAYDEGRILNVSPYDALLPTYVAMDIGVNDLTAIIFFQCAHGEIRIIDYYEDNRKGVDFYVNFITREKNYMISTIFLPHDAAKMDGIVVENTYEKDFRRLLANTAINVRVLKRTDVNLGISHAKIKFARCVFNGPRCKKLIESLGKYRKQWSEPQGRYLDRPLHNIHSNASDSFRYTCAAVNSVESAVNTSSELDKHRAAVESRRMRI